MALTECQSTAVVYSAIVSVKPTVPVAALTPYSNAANCQPSDSYDSFLVATIGDQGLTGPEQDALCDALTSTARSMYGASTFINASVLAEPTCTMAGIALELMRNEQ